MFKNSNNDDETTYSKIKSTATYDRNWWWMVHGKIIWEQPLFRIPKLSKNKQDKADEIKKIHKVNRYRNDWKFQLHWNKLGWVNPRSKIKGGKHYSFSSILKIFIMVIEHLIGLAIQNQKIIYQLFLWKEADDWGFGS